VSDGLKQRIAGALVLGALGLIILPVLFDFADPLKIDRTSKLPAAPEIESVQVVKAERPAGVPKKSLFSAIFDIDNSKPATDSSEAPYGLSAEDLPKAWVLQVSSFETKKNADEFMNRLRKNDYKAFVKSAKVKNQTRYRVYVGPKIDKRRAVQDKSKIDAAFNTDSIVLKYAL
jgi:DedD protein